MIRAIRRLGRRIAFALAPYEVTLATDPATVHRAWSPEDALSWAACYPRYFGPVTIINRRTGAVLAIRGVAA